MGWVTDEYKIVYKGKAISWLYLYEDNSYHYTVDKWGSEDLLKELQPLGMDKDKEGKGFFRPVKALVKEEYRVPGKKQPIYEHEDFRVERIAQETDERFLVYHVGLNPGENGYDEKDHSAPHYEGPKTPEGMREWCTWYAFRKMDDGTYQAELDESWWWGGSHNDGGTLHEPIPEEWHELPYEEFLENVVRVASAAHYNFTAEDLLKKPGLKAFFGFE